MWKSSKFCIEFPYDNMNEVWTVTLTDVRSERVVKTNTAKFWSKLNGQKEVVIKRASKQNMYCGIDQRR